MVPDITFIIADLLHEAIPNLELRSDYQAEALQENLCTVPEIGRLVDSNDVKYLLSALALENEDFASSFPNISQIEKQERMEFVAVMEDHFERCGHCARKRGYDLELNDQITRVCRENKDPLLELLEEGNAYVPEENLQLNITTKDLNKERIHSRPSSG